MAIRVFNFFDEFSMSCRSKLNTPSKKREVFNFNDCPNYLILLFFNSKNLGRSIRLNA